MSLHTAEQMFRAARLLLLTRYPFYGSLLAHLAPQFTDRVKTAAVDACDRVYLNPNFFAGLPNVEQRAFVLAHEALHPGLGIFWRGRGHDPVLSNVAHDYVINLILRDDNRGWLPPSALVDDKFARMSYEEVYGALVKAIRGGAMRPVLSMADVLTEGLDGEPSANLPRDAEALASQAQIWQARVIAAQLGAQAQGRGSLGMARAVGLSRGATVPWQEKLRRSLLEAFGGARADWARPHRRGCALGIYLPRETQQGCDAVVYVDTSGSISKENLESAVREIDGIIETCGGRVRWLQGDDGVLTDEWIHGAPETLKGGGGTSFVPLFEQLREGMPPNCAVIFTDTFGTMPDFVPEYPVVWAVYAESEKDVTERNVPFGEKIAVPAHAFVCAA